MHQALKAFRPWLNKHVNNLTIPVPPKHVRYQHVEDYARRKLTIDTDRLAAIAGLADKLPSWSWASGNLPNVSMWNHLYRTSPVVSTAFDCNMKLDHHLSSESKAVVNLHGRLSLTPRIQELTEDLLAKMKSQHSNATEAPLEPPSRSISSTTSYPRFVRQQIRCPAYGSLTGSFRAVYADFPETDLLHHYIGGQHGGRDLFI